MLLYITVYNLLIDLLFLI